MRSTQAIPFTYGVSISLSVSGVGSTTITTNQDAPFELHYIMARSDRETKTGETSQAFSFFKAQITDQSTGRQLSNQQVHQEVLCGPWNKSLSEKRAVIFPPGTIFTIDFTDLNASGTNVVDFYLKGYKLFQM